MMRALPYQYQAVGTSVPSGLHTDHVKKHHRQKDTGPYSDLVSLPPESGSQSPDRPSSSAFCSDNGSGGQASNVCDAVLVLIFKSLSHLPTPCYHLAGWKWFITRHNMSLKCPKLCSGELSTGADKPRLMSTFI